MAGSGGAGVQKVVFRRALPERLQYVLVKLQKTCAFFSSMQESEVREFLRLCRMESFDEGSLIFQRGEPGGCMYIVVSGQVSVVPGGAHKHEVRLGPGDAFGEMALLEVAPRSGSAWAMKKTVLLAASAEVLGAPSPFLRAKVMTNVARQLARYLREADAFIEGWAKEEKEEKAAPATP
ncbi:MAG: cyclic nucleotide-binding domain-containing protein [Candidatus Tectomicrobia bacterium]|uniref:Cyclic nucleotide-binding domain-containing protein n=1 Tax=Tectimicrobiota bacterium TaxID=2528274 RepID=A0A932MPX4_UNCTE|nr:cyclic nucleotide-binding domain-containing protein [Candidatus Tectomicrobia bacterium]